MWKYVTRGIRETLERRGTCRTNVYSQTTPDNGGSEVKDKIANKSQTFLASPVESCDKGFFGSAKTGGPKDKKYDSKWDTRRSWSEAVGWSSVLAVGWVVCQSLCLRKRFFDKPKSKEDILQNRLRIYDIHHPVSFIDAFNLHPQYVLPVTNCIANHNGNNNIDGSRHEWMDQRSYGPITIEEALKEAKDDYTKTHRVVMGDFELRFGVTALEEKRYEDALKHFTTGANLSSSGSMFNLGLCHELGIGTVTNTVKAAKYYNEAAKNGHPDAMYNLGVFHAQGRGGLEPDVDKARELFTEAASLGQAQAQIALDLETNVVSSKNDDVASECVQSGSFGLSDKLRNRRKGMTLLEMAGYQNSVNEDTRHESSRDSDAYCNESMREFLNPTDMFLHTLGIQTNPVPILVGSDDSNSPYYH